MRGCLGAERWFGGEVQDMEFRAEHSDLALIRESGT